MNLELIRIAAEADGMDSDLEIEREEYLRDLQIDSTQFGIDQPDLDLAIDDDTAME